MNLKNSPNTTNNTGSVSTEEPKKTEPKPRKYKLKPHQKKQITSDIKDAKANIEEIEKKIRKRFAKDDPEASFIVKYLSPIMAVAADRVHLSEEMKAFCENEKENGKIGNDEYMFGRFWKHNPQILDYYAQTITDTIDMFEETYGSGGRIPINKDLEVIKPDTQNQKAVDHVNFEFLELLNYTQTIAPEREKRYALHDKLQKDWDAHFIERYGLPTVQENLEIELPQKIEKTETNNKVMDIQEEFKDSLKYEASIYPSAYANKYIKYMTNNKDIDDNYRTAYCHYIGDKKIDPILSEDEFYEKFNEIESNFITENRVDAMSAKFAIIDTLAKHNHRNYTLYTMNTYDLPNIDFDRNVIQPIVESNKEELNRIYAEYKKPLKPSEVNQVVNALFEQIQKYKTQEEITEANTNIILNMLKEGIKTPPRADLTKQLLKTAVSKYFTFSKAILDTAETEEEKRAKFENIMLMPILDMVQNSDTILLLMIGEENLQNNFNKLHPEVKMNIIAKINRLPPNDMIIFKLKKADYDKEYAKDPKRCQKIYEMKIR